MENTPLFLYFCLFWGQTDGVQALLIALHSGLILGRPQEIIWIAMDGKWVCYKQDKCPTIVLSLRPRPQHLLYFSREFNEKFVSSPVSLWFYIGFIFIFVVIDFITHLVVLLT